MTPERRTELHPDARSALDAAARRPRPSQLPLAEARNRRRTAIERGRGKTDPEPVGDVADYPVPGPNGPVPIRVHVPEGDGPFPVLVWLHGGGWVLGGLDGADRTARFLTNAVGCTTVTVDYRLAPEHPFPTPLRDCRAVLDWVADAPSVIHGDLDRLAVGGSSAGGNLAAALSRLVGEEGGPPIAHQFLMNAALDTDLDTVSYRENGEGYGLTRADMAFYWDAYLADAFDRFNPLAVPLAAAAYDDLPPTTVLTTGYDPLRDEGYEYTERVRAAGIPTAHLHFPEMIHHVSVLFRQGNDHAGTIYDGVAARLADVL